MTTLNQWAIKHGVSHVALADLRAIMGVDTDVGTVATKAGSETQVQQMIRLEASRVGARIWRNNVGACKDETGRMIRYGLCNDSAALNKRIKSHDLIGIRPVIITPEHIGQTIGQFISREVKAPSWRYTGTDREVAQLAWGNMITSLGGDARFVTGEGSL
jgi:hypothetical protein